MVLLAGLHRRRNQIFARHKEREVVHVKEAKKRKVGAPRKYETPEELAKAIDDYFQNGISKRQVVVGRGESAKTIEVEIPTVTGLCIHCGFASRQSLYDYEKKEGFAYIIKRAQLFIENEYEELLQHGNVTGAIFVLKNMGWIDKQTIDSNVTVDKSVEERAKTLVDEALGRRK
jgi:hypothetical protein